MNNFKYTFLFDRNGKATMRQHTHKSYLKDKELLAIVRNPDNYRLFLGLTIMVHTYDFLKENKDVADDCAQAERTQKENPLRFFVPNSQEQVDFINDDDSSVCANVDPNRIGKSTSAWVKALVNVPTIKCHKEWEIFAPEVGIIYKPFRGPVSGAVATYNQAKLEDPIWKEIIKKWTPDKELGIYGRTYHYRNKKYAPSWGHDRTITFKESGSQIGFYTYEMDQGNYEGGALKWWLWDEQGKEAMFDGADRGTRTTSGRHFFSLTPHKVVGRPDTGAGGWIKPMVTGVRVKGHKVGTYTGGDIHDVPDWIYAEKDKEREIEKWETEPLKLDDEKALAEGRARLYGEWHETAGRVFDEWSAKHHWIDPLWEVPPDNYTLYRAIDHGLREPTVCLWFAVDEKQNVFIYREMYTRNRTIAQNVLSIIEMSGNRREKDRIGAQVRGGGDVLTRYEEKFVREAYMRTVMDSRSFSLPDAQTGQTHGWLYKVAGLRMSKAPGKHSEHWIPLINQMFYIDPNHTHPITKEQGSPHLFVFNTCGNLKREVDAYVYEERARDIEGLNLVEKPKMKDNHGPCFIAGTKIATKRGNVNIEDIRADDLVLTRKGWCSVLASGKTGHRPVMELRLDNGESLFGTPNHPIYSPEKDCFIPLDSLTYGMILWGLDTKKGEVQCLENAQPYQNASCSTGLTLGDIRKLKTDLIESTLSPICTKATGALSTSMLKYGKPPTATFRRTMSFITRMGILLTTGLRTLRRYLLRPMPQPTLTLIPQSLSSRLLMQRSFGRSLMPPSSGSWRTKRALLKGAENHGETWSQPASIAQCAVKNFSISLGSKAECTVLRHVTNDIAAKLASTMLLGRASSAIDSILSTNIPRQKPVRVLALTNHGEADVYNLSVADEPEYFANGILVHNCTMAYGAMSGLKWAGPQSMLKRDKREPRRDPNNYWADPLKKPKRTQDMGYRRV